MKRAVRRTVSSMLVKKEASVAFYNCEEKETRLPLPLLPNTQCTMMHAVSIGLGEKKDGRSNNGCNS